MHQPLNLQHFVCLLSTKWGWGVGNMSNSESYFLLCAKWENFIWLTLNLSHFLWMFWTSCTYFEYANLDDLKIGWPPCLLNKKTGAYLFGYQWYCRGFKIPPWTKLMVITNWLSRITPFICNRKVAHFSKILLMKALKCNVLAPCCAQIHCNFLKIGRLRVKYCNLFH